MLEKAKTMSPPPSPTWQMHKNILHTREKKKKTWTTKSSTGN